MEPDKSPQRPAQPPRVQGARVPGTHPGDMVIRRERYPYAAPSPVENVLYWLTGSPIASSRALHERISKVKALAVFSSDALSSVAYATEEILLVLLLAGSAGFAWAGPIAITIAALLFIVGLSYNQTIHAYPSGGGSYIVAKDNLGVLPGLIAGAALLIDYVLTVAVSISSGVAAVTSAVLATEPYRVVMAVAFVLLIALALAFEMSLGLGGFTYSFLYAHVGVFRGLRASARLGLFVLLFLGALAGYGYRALAAGARAPARGALLAVLCLAIVAEYRVHPALAASPSGAPDPYRFLATQPRGVVAEIPFANPSQLPGEDAYYAFGSTYHFFPLVNGYSGVYPKSYLARGARMQGFPDETSIDQLRKDGVRYVIVHEFTPREQGILDAVIRSGHFRQLGSFTEAGPGFSSRATVFRFE